ncbi:hypothetical protein [uncultured Roseobacter sp.]|uniref:hypothetical protein n=1 Tax=uncultured Roseobacter sp. TaxID=114847 RepID=UPI002605283A|nr:hypothetical protein [uncultured Roseobacter sp.]
MIERLYVDWVALYGAALSTLLALGAFYLWWFRDLHLTVHGFHQSQNWMGSGDAFAFAISNSGRRPTVVSKVRIRFFKDNRRSSSVVSETTFDQSTLWNPATKDVPIEGKPNNKRREPNVLFPGAEIHGLNRPISEYRPDKDWILITAYARGSSRNFSNWIEPMTLSEGGA